MFLIIHAFIVPMRDSLHPLYNLRGTANG